MLLCMYWFSLNLIPEHHPLSPQRNHIKFHRAVDKCFLCMYHGLTLSKIFNQTLSITTHTCTQFIESFTQRHHNIICIQIPCQYIFPFSPQYTHRRRMYTNITLSGQNNRLQSTLIEIPMCQTFAWTRDLCLSDMYHAPPPPSPSRRWCCCCMIMWKCHRTCPTTFGYANHRD